MRSYLQKHSHVLYIDDYSTPSDIYNFYVSSRGFFDPCPLYSSGFDFSVIDKNIFLNPPYSDIVSWVDWALKNYSITKKHHVLLIPSRTDTKYFHRLLKVGCDLEFIQGRLKFGNCKNNAPFPSVLVHLGFK